MKEQGKCLCELIKRDIKEGKNFYITPIKGTNKFIYQIDIVSIPEKFNKYIEEYGIF